MLHASYQLKIPKNKGKIVEILSKINFKTWVFGNRNFDATADDMIANNYNYLVIYPKTKCLGGNYSLSQYIWDIEDFDAFIDELNKERASKKVYIRGM
jgi:hypothetical protein